MDTPFWAAFNKSLKESCNDAIDEIRKDKDVGELNEIQLTSLCSKVLVFQGISEAIDAGFEAEKKEKTRKSQLIRMVP